ncbi:MAG: shikimate dehydrogenase [Pyrinomonadaceae bacterium]
MNNGKICISVCAPTADELVNEIIRAEPRADLIEIRFDCLAEEQLAKAVAAIREIPARKPLVATYRSPEQGGKRQLTQQQRLHFWGSLGNGFELMDLEEDIVNSLHCSKIIASHHDHDTVAADIEDIYSQLAATDAAVIKIAATANDICDAIPLWKLLYRARSEDREVIPIAMGNAGKWTRILGLAHGAFLTYASLGSGKETADGQVAAEELIELYRVKELDADTRVYGVIGDPITSSRSTYLHNPAFAAAGLNAVFIPLQVRDLDAFMTRMVLPSTREVELNFAGFAVTMPHKQAIQRYLTGIDPIAQAIGAVNTVKIDGEKLAGYNTDAPGFIAPLKQRFPDLKNARVAVLGSGGAARAVIYALKEEGADLTVFARDPQRAEVFATEFNIPLQSLTTVRCPVSTDVVVNATPLGMRGPNEDETPLTSNELSGVRFVYDLVTRADETPLLREARKAGVDAIGGVEMLIAQGIKQFEIWTGRDAPADLMRRSVMDRLS